LRIGLPSLRLETRLCGCSRSGYLVNYDNTENAEHDTGSREPNLARPQRTKGTEPAPASEREDEHDPRRKRRSSWEPRARSLPLAALHLSDGDANAAAAMSQTVENSPLPEHQVAEEWRARKA
jgi:hypothetical protein